MKIGKDGVFAFVQQGFGNRMRAIASAVILASLNNTRATIIWEPSEECNIHFHEIFLPHNLPFTLLSQHDAIKHLQNLDSFHFEKHTHTNTILSENHTTVNALVIQGGHEYKDPQISESQFISQKCNVYKSLQPTPQISSTINQWTSQNNPALLIGIHLRVYIDQFDRADVYDFQKDTSIQNTLETIQTIHNNNNNLKFFLACNHEPSKLNILKKCKELNIHTSSLHNHQNISLSDRSTKNSMLHSIAEFIILSKCLFIIGTYRSSFSDEAAAFNGNISMKICANTTPSNEPYHCYGLQIISNRNILFPNTSLLNLLQKK